MKLIDRIIGLIEFQGFGAVLLSGDKLCGHQLAIGLGVEVFVGLLTLEFIVTLGFEFPSYAFLFYLKFSRVHGKPLVLPL